MAQRRAEFPEPATRDHRGEGTERAQTTDFLRCGEWLLLCYQQFGTPEMYLGYALRRASMTAHSGAASPVQRATVSDRTRSIRFRSAIFSCTS